MPLKQCSEDGKSGWKWGDEGKCYTGPDAKKKALKQGYAENPKHFEEVMRSEGYSKYEMHVTIAEFAGLNNDEKRDASQ